ncbi:FCD domain-containing protein [Streptomyces sp. PSKA28]|uniref:FCD domain-containing protein n=1 Tax=Streptomyces himalayensis subsp. himalayensis TaxID=2756131 RepID=A0A7W0DVP9_9ACTN|nr:FCD domain-containing protein [Streptomyces himalayensis subsp. himalayensis]
MPQDHRSGRHRARPDRRRGSRRPAGAHRADAHLQDPEELVPEDLAFHADIVAATGNRTLESLLASVTRRTASARIWWALVKSDVLSWTHEQHLDICLPCAPATASPPSPRPAGTSTTWTPGWASSSTRYGSTDGRGSRHGVEPVEPGVTRIRGW